MFQRLKKERRIRRTQQPNERVSARVIQHDDCLVITLGQSNITIKLHDAPQPIHEVYDFVGFALAAVSMSRNIAIDLDFPVSPSFAERLDRITRAYRLWSIDTLAPVRVYPGALMEMTPRARAGGIICLSGGVDSLGAALEARADSGPTHGLLIAGADYTSAEDAGFQQLRDRVRRLAGKLDLELLVVENTIRMEKFNWGMLHGFNLGFCLHFLSPRFEYGAFAQDNTLYQQPLRGFWGNLAALEQLLTTDQFPVRTYGLLTDRIEKLRRIVAFDATLLADLSVCYTDKTTGENCGSCPKCIQTRAALHAIGMDDRGLFVAAPDIAATVRGFALPEKIWALRGRMVRTAELVDDLPDGEIRDAFAGFEAQLHHRYRLMMPPN